jgi:hypothetical protein
MPHENKFKNEKLTPYTNAEIPVILSNNDFERFMDRVISIDVE